LTIQDTKAHCHLKVAVGGPCQQKLVAARPAMISFLDTVRDKLEDLSPELGVSGQVVLSR